MMMHQPVLVDPPRFTVPWASIVNCFYPRPEFDREIGLHKFIRTTFSTEKLQDKLEYYAKDVPEAIAPVVPSEWYTTGYADKQEVEDHGRNIALQLKELGVDVVGVPEIPPYRLKFFNRTFLQSFAEKFPSPSIVDYLQRAG